jgi:biopolymer transport protein TolR
MVTFAPRMVTREKPRSRLELVPAYTIWTVPQALQAGVAMQKLWRSNRLICNIDVTAFAGVMFALVAMFMLPAMTIVHPRGTSVDLAKIDRSIPMRAAEREDAMLIAVTREGKVFFRADPVRPEQLPAMIRNSVSRGSERKVYIKADARAKYSWVAEVLDGVHTAGIEKVGFLVDQRRTPSGHPQ